MDKQLYFGSYGHRYSDPCGGFMGFDREKVAEAIEQAIKDEEFYLQNACDYDHEDAFDIPERECSFCNPELCFYGIYAEYRPVHSGYVRLSYLKEAWADIKAGQVVPTESI